MIIGHMYQYLFVELPNTGSTAIRRELCELYGGEPILSKHSYYEEFLRTASPEEKTYFTFSCIRNPLDIAVSLYFKYKTNWKDVFTDPELTGLRPPTPVQRRYEFIQRNDADFATYFKRFYRLPYDDWSSLSHKAFDYVIRFERLDRDFAQVLDMLKIPQQRPLAVVNRTAEKSDDFWSYYTPEIRNQAVKRFGPFMERWSYGFPSDWGDTSVTFSSRFLFEIMGLFRRSFQWSSPTRSRLFLKLADLLHA